MKLAVYGKGGIGKSTTSTHISIALAYRGKKVLQIGCDPKHDSTFTLTGFLIPTIIDTLQAKDYHYEDVWPEDVIYKGCDVSSIHSTLHDTLAHSRVLNGKASTNLTGPQIQNGCVDCVEAGGPPAGAGCGGYVVGETVKLLKELNAFYEYDVILFDVLGDVVCGGFAAPLNYSDYCLIVTDNGFDALFAANRIAASVREKARTHPLRLAGLIGNRTLQRDLIDIFIDACPAPILQCIPTVDDLRVSRVKGKTLFDSLAMNASSDASSDASTETEIQATAQYICDLYLNIADQLLARPEGVVPREIEDRKLFRLLSNFYLEKSPSPSGDASGDASGDTEENIGNGKINAAPAGFGELVII